jgi:hypothetical protein
MSIHDFHSKLVSGKDEGRLFEALRKLKGVESVLAIVAQEPSAWYEWTESSGLGPNASLATIRA